MIAIFWTALHPTNEEDVANWSPVTIITAPTIITATTATTTTTTTATTTTTTTTIDDFKAKCERQE